MTATDTSAALLAAICAAPDDDFPRAAYADWLEEAGEWDRALWIREGLSLNRHFSFVVAHTLTRSYSPRQPTYHYEKPDWAKFVHIRRGFVQTVICTCDAWLEHGPAFVRQEPVMRVELMDKRPVNYRVNDLWEFFKNHDGPSPFEYELPLRLALHMPHGHSKLFPLCFLTRPPALDALSDACLAYARATHV